MKWRYLRRTPRSGKNAISAVKGRLLSPRRRMQKRSQSHRVSSWKEHCHMNRRFLWQIQL
uniref:Uncharacterized protein n=1 Tax=Phlebotomus papatasi TaxID=29031 RepID=A0A1B0DK27_PHLPP